MLAALPKTEPVTPKPSATRYAIVAQERARDQDDDRHVDSRRKAAGRVSGHDGSLDEHRIKSCVRPAALPTEADLQLIFARLNYEYFNGEAPDCRIAYNERFSNSAGRITYGRPPLVIELSPKHFRA